MQLSALLWHDKVLYNLANCRLYTIAVLAFDQIPGDWFLQSTNLLCVLSADVVPSFSTIGPELIEPQHHVTLRARGSTRRHWRLGLFCVPTCSVHKATCTVRLCTQ